MYVGYYIYVYVYMYVYFLACCFCVSFFVCLGVNADTKRDVTLQGWRKRCRHINSGTVNRKTKRKTTYKKKRESVEKTEPTTERLRH